MRILPSGEVYIFTGYFNEEYRSFFKLKFLNDNSNACMSFPLKKAVRLEKTNALRPKGKGQGRNTRGAGFITQKTINAFFHEPLLPAPDASLQGEGGQWSRL